MSRVAATRENLTIEKEQSMSGESAAQGIKGSYGEGFVIMGTDRIEVSPDGKKVTVYTNGGVETKTAAGQAAAKGTHISEDFNTVVLNGVTIERSGDGHLVISSPGIFIAKPSPANDSAKSKAALQIGAIEPDGAHKGEIYGGRWSKEDGRDNKPSWFL